MNDRVAVVRRRARVGAGGEEQLGRAFLEARARGVPAHAAGRPVERRRARRVAVARQRRVARDQLPQHGDGAAPGGDVRGRRAAAVPGGLAPAPSRGPIGLVLKRVAVRRRAPAAAPERGHERRHVTFIAAAGLGEVVVGRGRGAEVAEERRAEARRRQLSAVRCADPAQIRVARRQHRQRHRRELRRRFDEIGRVLDAEDLAYEAQRRVEPPAPFRGDNSRVASHPFVESWRRGSRSRLQITSGGRRSSGAARVLWR